MNVERDVMYSSNTCRVVVVITTTEVENEEVVEEAEAAVLEAVVVDITINKTSPRRNPSLTQANIWTRRFVFDSMAVEKVCMVCVCKRYTADINEAFYLLVVGTLKGYDPLLNLVLDDTIEYQKGIYA